MDLTVKFVGGKFSVDIFSKPTNSFTYVSPSTCYPRTNINNVPLLDYAECRINI